MKTYVMLVEYHYTSSSPTRKSNRIVKAYNIEEAIKKVNDYYESIRCVDILITSIYSE
jgi:hypothetical protein